MVSKTLTLGLTVAATVAFAGPAQASVVDTDRPELNGTGYDFGNGTFVAGSPTRGGRLEFDLSNGRIEPRLTGTLHVNDADGTCARVKLAYRDRGNDALTDPAYSRPSASTTTITTNMPSISTPTPTTRSTT